MTAEILRFPINRNSLSEIQAFMRKNLHPFKPCAYYVEGLDMLVVQMKDCSYTLRETSNYGGILYENQAEEFSIIGFQVFGIRYFVEKAGLKLAGLWVVEELMVKTIAPQVNDGLREIFGWRYEYEIRKILKENNFVIRT